jgi:putative flippase GtrA
MWQTIFSFPLIQRLFNKISNKSILEIIKYIFVGLGGYIYVLILMYIFIDLLRLSKSLSYFFIYLLAYVFDYLLTLKYVFQKKHKSIILLKYGIYLIVFFILNNALFNTLIYFNIYYMLSTIIVILILFPLRFFTMKLIIFI